MSPEFQGKIEANSGTVIVSGVKHPDDAEYYAGLLGTRTTTKQTIQKEAHLFFMDRETGMKTVRDVEEFVLHPNRIKELDRGEVLAISRTVDPDYGIVSIPLPPTFDNQDVSDMVTNLEHIRSSYSDQRTKYLSLTQRREPPPSSETQTKKLPAVTPPRLPGRQLSWKRL